MQFDTMKKGYNRFQVDDAIDKLQQEVENLTRKLEVYKKQSEEDKKRIGVYKEKYQKLLHDIDIREKAVKDMTKIALNEASGIVNSANDNADMIVREALLSAKSILIGISKLGIEAGEVKENLNKQLSLLSNVIEEFDIPPIPNVELIEKKYKE